VAAGVTAGVDSTAAGLREVFGGVLDFEEDLDFSGAFAFGRVWAGALAVALVAGAARFRAGALAGADVDRAALVARVFAAPALAAFFAPAFAGAPFAPDFLAPDPAAFAGLAAPLPAFDDARVPLAAVDLEDFLRVFLDIRLPFVAFGGSMSRWAARCIAPQ